MATIDFVGTPKSYQAIVSTANTNRDGTGTLVTLATGATGGTRINWISCKAQGGTSTGMLRFFIDNTSTTHLWREIPVVATPLSTATTTTWEDTTTLRFYTSGGDSADRAPLVLANGHILKVSTHVADTFDVCAFGGDL